MKQSTLSLIILISLLLITVILSACASGAVPVRTPIPTLIPATLGPQNIPAVKIDKINPIVAETSAPGGKPQATKPAAAKKCSIAPLDLIGLWVKAGKPEKDSFEFTDVNSKKCKASFAEDISTLFTTPNLWYQGALACVNCHTADVNAATANLSLTNYANIMAGSRRTGPDAKGNDILGDGSNWESSLLYKMIFTRMMPVGRPADSPEKGPVLKLGRPEE